MQLLSGCFAFEAPRLAGISQRRSVRRRVQALGLAPFAHQLQERHVRGQGALRVAFSSEIPW